MAVDPAQPRKGSNVTRLFPFLRVVTGYETVLSPGPAYCTCTYVMTKAETVLVSRSGRDLLTCVYSH